MVTMRVRAATLAVVCVSALVPGLLPTAGVEAQDVPAPPEAIWRELRPSVEDSSWTPPDVQCGVTDIEVVMATRAYAALKCGRFGSILRTDDGGATWQVVSRESVDFFGADFTEESNPVGIAVGRPIGGVGQSDSVVLRSSADTGDGIEWAAVHHEESVVLNNVAFVMNDESADEGPAVAVGAAGTILRSTDGGRTWDGDGVTVLDDPVEDLHAVAFLPGAGGPDVARGVAVGAAGTMLVTADGGATWDHASSSPPVTSRNLTDVAVVRDGKAVLGVAVTEAAGIVRTHDPELREWVVVDSNDLDDNVSNPNWKSLHAVALGDASPGEGSDGDGFVGYAVGSGLPPQGETAAVALAMTDTEGANWQLEAVESPSGTDSPLTAVGVWAEGDEVPAGGRALAGGERGALKSRTPVSDAASLADDPWRQCIPRGQASAVEERTGQDVPDELVCRHDGPEDISSGTPPAPFGSTEAVACRPEADRDVPEGFPCVATWRQRDDRGRFAGDEGFEGGADVLFFDGVDDDGDGEADGFGAGGRDRRVIAVASTRKLLFMFDPEGMEQRGVAGFGDHFGGESQSGGQRGVVRLSDLPSHIPWESISVNDASDVGYDPVNHRIFFMVPRTGCTPGCVREEQEITPPGIVTVSLTGAFEPRFDEIEVLGGGRASPVLVHVAYDSTHGVLYALSRAHPHMDQSFPAPNETVGEAQTSLHTFEVGADGQVSAMWPQPFPLEDRCSSTVGLEADAFAVSDDGTAVTLACTGHSVIPHFGSPNAEPNRIVTLKLRLRGRHPGELEPQDPTDVTVFTEPVAGKVFFEDNRAFPVRGSDLFAWNLTGASLWNPVELGWTGAIPFGGITGGAADPATGRLYFTSSAALLIADTVNLPVMGTQDEIVPNPSLSAEHPVLAVPPVNANGPTRLFASSDDEQGELHLYEDRVPRELPDSRPDPDSATRDIPDAEAEDVSRRSRGEAYGTRVWGTGLGSVLPGMCDPIDPQEGNAISSCDGADFTYSWLFDAQGTQGAGGLSFPYGEHTSAVPAPPATGERELRFGATQEAALTDILSEAKATAFFYDGGPADEPGGNTSEDVKRRRGARDMHDFVDAEVGWFTGPEGADNESPNLFPWEGSEAELCDRASSEEDEQACRDGHDDFRDAHAEFDNRVGPWEVCFDEAIDVAMREVDGDRRVQGCNHQTEADDPETKVDESRYFCEDDEGDPEDCFTAFEEMDRRDDPETDADERGSVEERAGLTYRSSCLDPGDESSARGSSAMCDLDGQRTRGSAALGGVSLVPSDADGSAVRFSVGSSGSDVDLFRDPELGIVSEAAAFAAEVELVMPAGSLSIGEVRTTARAWARGHTGTADSWIDVAYEDVIIQGPDGQTRFACGRADPDDQTGLADDPRYGADRDGDGEADGDVLPAACDPQRVVDVINRVFPRVQATTSGPDTDPKVTGSPGGAQAIVKRDPTRVMSDFVVNQIEGLLPVPGLQLTVFNDGLRPNRMQIDLAAVFAETHYEIGLPRTERRAEPGAVRVELADPAERPLSGGEFVVLDDADGDGEVSASDPAVGECTTAASGSCVVDGLSSGSYLVRQRLAPPGFLAQDAAVPVFVSEGSTETVEFVNAPNSAGVVVELVDLSGRPLAGGEFVLAADRAGDGLDPSDRVVGSCVTGGEGTCAYEGVPLGGWVLHQAAAPQGLEAADDVVFGLHRPGQVARITVVNGAGGSGSTIEIIEILSEGRVSDTEGGGGPAWWAVLPGTFADILLRDPIQALLFALTGLLFGTPAYLAVRRRELSLVRGGG